MKKVLLTAAAVAALSTSAFAEGMMDQFYLRGDLGGVMVPKFKTNGAKQKTKFGLGLDLGVGYYIMDNVRAELVYTQPFGQNMKGNQAFNNKIATSATITEANINKQLGLTAGAAGVVNTDTLAGTQYFKHKPTVRALLARVSGDVVDLGMAKIFLTGGLGWAQVKDKTTVTWTGSNYSADTTAKTKKDAAGTTGDFNYTTSAKAKNKNNLAWTIGAGAAFDVSEGVHLEAAYSWRDYGKSKASTIAGLDTADYKVGATSFRSHNFTAGVRFDI
jgi:opacity protein-like surface antigen